MLDWAHPNELGHEIAAQSIADQIKSIHYPSLLIKNEN
jgi:hypothetical protein